jgi:hypothetical protein
MTLTDSEIQKLVDACQLSGDEDLGRVARVYLPRLVTERHRLRLLLGEAANILALVPLKDDEPLTLQSILDYLK